MTDHFLGIDLGTTSLSLTVTDPTGEVFLCKTVPHSCAMTVEGFPDAFAIDPVRLIALAKEQLIAALEEDAAITTVGVTGQMHGIACVDGKGQPLTPLYTWQCAIATRKNGRKTFLEELEELTGQKIPVGYGLSTLYALKRLGRLPEEAVTVATAGDLFLSEILGKAVPMHPTNAASLGGFDLKKCRFAEKVWKKAGLSHLMPSLSKDFDTVGTLTLVNRTLTVSAAIGDNQASVYGTLTEDSQVLVNVGTGSQISAITQKPRENTDIRPYFGGKYLSVYAALCGGRAYRMLYDLVKGILADFGCDADEEAIYAYLNRAAEKNSKLKVTPTFAGRFDDPEAKGSIEGITTENFTLPALANGFLKGMIRELYEAYLTSGGEDGAIPVVSGNAMRKNPTLRKLTHRIFGMETLMPKHREEASFGAALYGGISAGLISEQDRKNAIGYTCG